MTKIINRKDINEDIYKEIFDKESHHNHIIIQDENGTYRWEENVVTRTLVDLAGLNELVVKLSNLGIDKNNENYRKMYREMGYSLYGYWEIFYWEVNNPKASSYNIKN